MRAVWKYLSFRRWGLRTTDFAEQRGDSITGVGRWLSLDELIVFLALCQEILNFIGLSVRRCSGQPGKDE